MIPIITASTRAMVAFPSIVSDELDVEDSDELDVEGACLAWKAEMIEQGRVHQDPEALETREDQYCEDLNKYQRKWDKRWLV